MDRTDETAKLFLTKNQVFADLVDFALRHSGFKVDHQSLLDRNPEGIIQCPWNSLKYKVCNNDLLKGLVVKHSDKATWMLVATEHQSYVSNTMPLRNLITAAAHWDGIRRSREDGSVRVAMTAGTLQPKPISSGTMLRPLRPILRSSLSVTKATRAM